MVRDEEHEKPDDKGQPRAADKAPVAPLCWPFPVGSQNNTDKAIKLKPYVPPKKRSLNQY